MQYNTLVWSKYTDASHIKKPGIFSELIFDVEISFQYDGAYILVMVGIGNLEDDFIAFGIDNFCSLWCIFVHEPIL